MPKPVNGELDDEAVHLVQRGLYVQPINYQLDENQSPSNGHEYIHLVRMETKAIFPEDAENEDICICVPKQVDPNTCREQLKQMSLKKWKNLEARFFSQLAIDLRSLWKQLVYKFPQKHFPSVDNEKDCCLFCLGSEMYKTIFNDEVKKVESNIPYLSIVLYFRQEEILILLKYMSEWSTIVGMNHEICRWIYALLACLLKPVSEECEEFLETFYDDCKKRLEHCDETEKNQLHLISAILNSYFCVKAYTIGAPLAILNTLN